MSTSTQWRSCEEFHLLYANTDDWQSHVRRESHEPCQIILGPGVGSDRKPPAMDEYEGGERLCRIPGPGQAYGDSNVEREVLEVGLDEGGMGQRLLDEAVLKVTAVRV